MFHSVADRARPVTEAMNSVRELGDGFLWGVVCRSTAKLPDDVFIQDHARLRASTSGTGSRPALSRQGRGRGHRLDTDRARARP